jgi:hypothetical protein
MRCAWRSQFRAGWQILRLVPLRDADFEAPVDSLTGLSLSAAFCLLASHGKAFGKIFPPEKLLPIDPFGDSLPAHFAVEEGPIE